MTKVASDMAWSWFTMLGMVLGYLTHLIMSWGEWRKLTGHEHMSLLMFIRADIPSFLGGLLSTIILYLGLPELASAKWIVDWIGFAPQMNFISAAMTAYLSNSITIKIRNIARKLDGSGP